MTHDPGLDLYINTHSLDKMDRQHRQRRGRRSRSKTTQKRRVLQSMNPDKGGQVSWAVLAMAFGVMLAAAAIFTFYWITLDLQNKDDKNTIRDLRSEYQSLMTFIEGFPDQCNCTGVNQTFPVSFADDVFFLFNVLDPSKLAQFNVSGLVSPSSLSRLTIQNTNGTIAYLADIPSFPTTFLDDAFTVVHADDNSKAVMLNCSGIGASTIQVMTVQDASGVIAYLSDITAPIPVFEDDVFAVQNAINTNKEVQLDVSLVGSGITQTMTIQDASGTIAYLSDIVAGGSSFPDNTFRVQHVFDTTAQVALNLSLVSGGSLTLMTVQDASGTIAYVGDVTSYTDVHINTTRTFPDISHEGVSTLAGLGITRLRIWLCGGGGGGGGSNSVNGGAGGGSSSAVELFFVDDAADLFTDLNCTIGLGGAGGAGASGGGTDGSDGDPSSLIGNSISQVGFLELFGYGGGGGLTDGGQGGAGGGSGSKATTTIPGLAGSEAGLIGSLAGLSGAFRYPWHGGGGGGNATLDGSLWHGGGSGGVGSVGGGGAGSLFATGGDAGAALNQDGADGGICAGGGGAANTNSVVSAGDGGDGHIFIRYWSGTA